MTVQLRPIASIAPTPVDETAFVERLRLTGVAAGAALLGVPALILAILSILWIPLVLVWVGVAMAHGVVPATEQLTRLQRRFSGRLLGEEIPATYADTRGTNFLTRPGRWLRDQARWRDVGFLWFSGTGGWVMSAIVPLLLVSPAVHLVGAILDGGVFWWLLVLLGGPLLLVWWLITPAMVRARAVADRNILGGSRLEQLERRVEQVTASRSESVDHSAAEIRRIERDLHDGAQARIVSLGMNLGLAEQLIDADRETLAALLGEARQSTVDALEDLRSVVRGIHPPVLADRGLSGAVAALTIGSALPVTLSDRLIGRPPAPVESAVYFAIAECLANAGKHSQASRAWVQLDHRDGVLTVMVGDDGRGGADPGGSGLTGIARRLSAFDGTLAVSSPVGGPTTVTLEVPCALSSPKTTPFSGTGSSES